MKKKNKRFFRNVFFFIAVVVIIIFIILKFWPKEPLVKREVSERAMEYMEAPVEKKEAPFISTDCFDIQMPFYVRNPKTESEGSKCVLRATLDDPHAFVTVSAEYFDDLESLKKHTGVSLRLRESEKYYQENFGKTNLVDVKVFSTDDEISHFSFENNNVVIVSLHDLVRFDDNTYELLEQIVDAVELR